MANITECLAVAESEKNSGVKVVKELEANMAKLTEELKLAKEVIRGKDEIILQGSWETCIITNSFSISLNLTQSGNILQMSYKNIAYKKSHLEQKPCE